jgi:hypothetical protein
VKLLKCVLRKDSLMQAIMAILAEAEVNPLVLILITL